MKRSVLIIALLLTFVTAQAYDVVVSIRYLQIEGKSHASLYLFESDGKLIRKLTNPGKDQDFAPVFSPDGKEIAFRRGASESDPVHWFVVDRERKKTRALPAEPAWFAGRAKATQFGDSNSLAISEDQHEKPGPQTYASADGTQSVVVKPNPEDEEHPLAFLQEKGRQPAPFTGMPGYSIFWFLMLQKGDPFLITPKLRAAFFCGEHDSTLGTTTYALDATGHRIVTLSANGAGVLPWPQHDGFWVIAQSRYEELGDGRTVNCSYLDWYDPGFNRTRFGHPLGIYYGASVFEKGKGAFTLPSPLD